MSEASKYKGTQIKTLKFKDHAKKRSMWLGSLVSSEHELFVLEDGLFRKQTLEYSDALFKCIDEILVNAMDQYINAINLPANKGGSVTEVKISFDIKTGEISVTNDGQGMPVYRMDDPDDPKNHPWTVQNIISKEFTGANFDDEGSPDRVTGGINGLGIKVVNALCKRLEVETVDWTNFRYYNQVCHDGMNKIDEPTVIDLKKERNTDAYKALNADQRKPHTTLKFIPNYTELCKISSRKRDKHWYNKERGLTIMKLIETRTYQLAAFVVSTSYRYDREECIDYKKKAKIYFNDTLIEINSLSDYAMMYGLSNVVSTEIKSTATARRKKSSDEIVKFPWSIAVNVSPAAINDRDAEGIVYDTIEYKSFEQVSLLNAVHLTKGGSHVNALLKMIQEALRNRIEKLLSTKYRDDKGKPKDFPANVLKNNLFIFNSLQIPIPQFAGQTKESVTLSSSDLKSFKETYELPKSFITKIWQILEPVLKYKFLIQGAGSKVKKQNYVRKYDKAKFAGKRQALDCGLIVPEGDSAETTMNSIITSRKSSLNKNFIGTYNIQGVPMNALKEIKEIVVGKHTRIKQSKRLQQNAGLQGLYQVLGLNYDYTYYAGDDPVLRAKGDKEFSTLNYGYVVWAVDQDLDGIGQICSLGLVYFMVFFPQLIKRGFVKRWASPVIRIYPTKGDVLEFFSDKEFSRWREDNFGVAGDIDDIADIPKGYKVKYYKGLATHSKAEVEHMASTYEQNVYTFTWDDAAQEFMDVMYGSDTEPRKAELKTPVSAEYDEDLFEQQIVEIGSHFQIETKSFQLDFMERKLPSAVDGMIPSQRKAFAGARRIWANGGSEMKVYQVTGYVTKQLHYQHGDSSMNDTITKENQTFNGALNIPKFTPISNGFGDIKDGRSKTGQARYIETKLNNRLTDVMFPRGDDYMLPHAYDDGVQCEPKYYVPIMPMAVLNTVTTVSVGWKIMCWARDFKFTLQQVRHMIKYDYPEPAGEPMSFRKQVWLQPGMTVFEGKYGKGSKDVTEICLGDYEWEENTNTVKITQLPLKVWSYKLKCSYIGCKPYDEKTTTRKTKEGEIPLPKKEHVLEVMDNTGNNIADMHVVLKQGAIDEIEENYGDANVDPIMDYLDLKQNLETHLNMISKDGGVIEFENYADIVKHWFPIRRQLYEDRLEREIILLKFQIIHWENVQNFIRMEKADEINVNDIPEEEQIETLDEQEFVRINLVLLEHPKYTKTEDLQDAIFGDSASFKYILDKITKRMCSTQQIQLREELIEVLKARLRKLEESTYKDLWNDELDKLEKVVAEGIKTDWLFGTKKHVFTKVTGGKKKSKK
jgi:DNA gyrase/topoisomerase IV subunit B